VSTRQSARRYAFTHRSWVDADPDDVHALLVDLEHYPSWWRQVRAVASLGPDRALVVCRSVLPYDLELVLDAVSRDPRHLEVAISGPIDGFARWTLADERAGTALEYVQVVTARGRLAWASYALKPVLRWNHAVMMRGFDAGLATGLSAARGDRTTEPPS
jgi:hypothetical protein